MFETSSSNFKLSKVLLLFCSAFVTPNGLTEDDIFEMLLIQYNVSTMEELLAKFGKDGITITFNSTLPRFENYILSFNITPTNETLPTFNTSEMISTEDPLNISEHTTTQVQTNVSNETTIPFVIFEEGPPLLEFINKYFDWNIFPTENYTTSKLEGLQPPAEHFDDPKDKWDLVKTKFKTTFRNVHM